MNKKVLKKYLVGDFTLKRVIRSFLFIYISISAYGWFISDGMLFQPHTPSYTDNAQVIKIELPDGSHISAIYLKNKDAEYTVLYNHANAVDLGDLDHFISTYKNIDVSIFTYDYLGYGTSQGKATTANTYKSADAAMDYLVKQVGVDNIIIHGRSVGGGAAIYLAHTRDVAGLIAESSFVTAFRTMTHIPITPFDKFRNIAKIGKVNCPVLIIHGKEDRAIPFWHGEKLFDKAKEPKFSCWLDGANHNYIPAEAETKYWSAISSFLKLCDEEMQHVR